MSNLESLPTFGEVVAYLMRALGADAGAMRAHAEGLETIRALLPLLEADRWLWPLAVVATMEPQGDTDLCAACGSACSEAPNRGTFALRIGLPGLCIPCWGRWLAESAQDARVPVEPPPLPSVPTEGPVDELDFASWEVGEALGTEDFADPRTTFLCFVTARARAARKGRVA